MDNRNILIVDDEPYLATALNFVLTKEGYKVSIASDGEEALREINEKNPAVIFLDIMMPKKNGYEVCKIIKNTPELKNIYVIMLSAKSLESDKEQALSVGANDFMSKPYSPREAVAKTKCAMESLQFVRSD
jgi:two-component system, OmpR family, alkaline phosphatase synthesis response regulator PhoP